VTVTPYKPKAPANRVGFLKGFVSIPSDFDRLGCDEIAEMFEGSL